MGLVDGLDAARVEQDPLCESCPQQSISKSAHAASSSKRRDWICWKRQSNAQDCLRPRGWLIVQLVCWKLERYLEEDLVMILALDMQMMQGILKASGAHEKD